MSQTKQHGVLEVDIDHPQGRVRKAMRLAGWGGVLLSAGSSVLFVLGAFGVGPIDYADMEGIKTGARVLITGLLLSAIGFWDL